MDKVQKSVELCMNLPAQQSMLKRAQESLLETLNAKSSLLKFVDKVVLLRKELKNAIIKRLTHL